MMSDPVRHGLRLKLLAVLVAACYGSAQANPGGPQVVAGQASFLQQGNLYSITNTPNAIINWQNFSINPNEITRFIQQSGDSKVLNRIVGQDPSKILGSLQSNGKVYLINPNGVLFGKDARVDVNGLVASSLAISNADFLAGRNHFAGEGAGKVVNQGSITTPDGGQVYLIASSVENSGVITSPQGEVVLAAGKSVQLVDSANPDVHVVVSAPADQALNLGQVLAAGGKVGIYGALVNQRGRVSADSAALGANGKIVLKASGTTLLEAGSRTSAVNAAGKGGEIQLLGDRVGLTDDAAVDASGAAGGGTVLIGGDYQGKNAAVPHARQTYIGEHATVRADATQQGDGGKVVAWSDGATRVFGSLSARGGAQGGDGGMLETSGKYLDMQGRADTRAPKGKTGSLLLDPTDIFIADSVENAAGMLGTNIRAAAADGEGKSIFQEADEWHDSLVLASTLNTALESTDVTISTVNAKGLNSTSGFIKVVDPVTWSSSQSLTLRADTDIFLNAPITGLAGALNLNAVGGLIAQSSTQANALQVASLSAMAAGNITLENAGNLIIGTATMVTSGGNALLTAYNVNLGASSASGSGKTLTATATDGDLTVSGAVSSSGDLSLFATKADAGITVDTGASVRSSAGNVALQSDRMALNGALGTTTQHGISLAPISTGTNISIGGSAADATSVLGLSADELANVQLPANGWLSIGVGSGANTLTVAGDLNLTTGQNSGSLLLQTYTGALNIASGADLAATGVISLQTSPSGSNKITNSGTVTSASGINLFSGRMALAGGTLTAPSVSLESSNPINLGASTAVDNTLTLSAADLASVTPTGALYVSVNSSNVVTGDIVVSAPLSYAGNLTLSAQNDLTVNTNSAVTTGNLALNAKRNIGLQSSITTGGLALYTPGSANTPGIITATGAVAVSGTFELLDGKWTQSSGTLPAFSASDFRLSGGSFLRVLGGTGGDEAYTIADVYGLQGIATQSLGLRYVLGESIDASGTSAWNSGAGFVPIGSSGNMFSGEFNGDGQTITGLTVNRPTSNGVGLFGYVNNGTIQELTLSGGSMRGQNYVGSVAGNVLSGRIQDAYSSASVSGINATGGLAGYNGGYITGSSASGAVTGLAATIQSETAAGVGGLVGSNTGVIDTSSATGNVSSAGVGYVGGLVGINANNGDGGSIAESYASGNVTASGTVAGGLVGKNLGGAISVSYASGNVAAGSVAGGLVGYNYSNGSYTASLSKVYAKGNVAVSSDYAGGLVGQNDATVSNAYSAGSVGSAESGSHVHGLIGANTGTLSNGYFDSTLAGVGVTAGTGGGTGLTSAQMMQQASFANFNFSDGEVAATWRIYEGYTTPLLKSMLAPLTVTVTGSGVTKVYDRASATFAGSGAYTGFTGGDTAVSGTLGWNGARDVGSYSIGGLYSTKYDISYHIAEGSNPVLAITPAQLTAQLSGSKVYNRDTSFNTATVALTGVLDGDTVTGSAEAKFQDWNAGTNKTLTDIAVTLDGANKANYQLSSSSGTATITPALLTVTGITGVDRSYNGMTDATVTGTPVFAAIAGDTVTASVAGNYNFIDKEVGVGKSITAPLTLGGDHAGNYQALVTATGTITKAPLAISGLTGVSRVYNATTAATVTGGTLSGTFSGDTVQVSSVHAYFTGDQGKNVGSNKTIGFTGTDLTGTGSSNYEVTSYPGNVTASVTPAALTASGLSANSRVYNGSTSATLNVTEGGQLSGVLLQDSVSLNTSNYTAAFADRNVGTGKAVTVSGLTLAGTDAGNYTFTAPSLSANITQLGKATWTGSAGNNLWSDSGNWSGGAVPVASNVLAAELGMYGGEVIYDAGSTTLSSLTGIHFQPLTVTISGGTLAVGTINTSMSMGLTVAGGALTLGAVEGASSSLTGGALTVSSGSLALNSALTTGAYAQSGGALSGAGSLNATGVSLSGGTLSGLASVTTSSFNQSGGAISGLSALTINSAYAYSGGTVVVPGSVSIHHNSGNLTVGPITALEGISLNVSEGAGIAQSGALNTNHLMVSSQNGVALDNSANHVLHFSGTNYGSGGISLHNTLSGSDELGVGPLSTSGGSIAIDNVGGIYTEGTLSAALGAVSLTAHSPITISNTVQGNSVSLSASTGITLSSSSSIQAVNDISMTAGTGIQLAGTLQSTSGGISLLAQTGSISADSNMTISGAGAITLSATLGSISAPEGIFQGGSVPVLNDGAAAAAAKAAADAAAAKAAADAAAKAAAEAAEKAAADAAAKAVADAAAKAAADAAAKAAADAAADAAAKAAADAAAKAAADAAAKAAADAVAKAAADAAAEAAVKAAAEAAAKAAQDALAKAAADAAAKAAADAAAEAAAKAAADAAAKAAAEAAAKAAEAAAEAAVKAAQDAAAKAASDAAAKAAAAEAAAKAAQEAAQAAADAAAKAAHDEATAKAAAEAAAKAARDAAAKAAADVAAKAATDAAAKAAADASQGQSKEPVGQALNATVNIINTTATTATTSSTKEVVSMPKLLVNSTPGEKEESKATEVAKEEKKDGIASTQPELKKVEPVKKMYCN
ncbi:YDG domain-containing protein [Pseudoduganella sp. LjRoot289]|uniref:YDG domain-containing protein n=1 Tax=Pseudoduganella sp. LjRoot289 TaxID=3342314 RepID=UPI003ED03187